jgi:hypothetical protein
MFIAWDYKFLSCPFEGVYTLDVINISQDFLYENIPRELQVYDTHDYSTQYDDK